MTSTHINKNVIPQGMFLISILLIPLNTTIGYQQIPGFSLLYVDATVLILSYTLLLYLIIENKALISPYKLTAFIISISFLLVTVYFLSILTSQNLETSKDYIQSLPGRVLFFVATFYVASTLDIRKWLPQIVTIVCVASIFIFFVRTLGVLQDVYSEINTGTVKIGALGAEYHRNFGLFFISGQYAFWHALPYTIFLYLTISRGLFRTYTTLFLVLALTSIATLTLSQSKNFALMIAIITVLYFWEKTRFGPRKHKNFQIINGFILSIALVLAFSVTYFLLTDNAIKNIIPSRVIQFTEAINVIKENPLLGIGPGNFQEIYSTTGHEIHNSFLKIFASSGFFSFLAYLALWVTGGVALYKKSKTTKNNDRANRFIVYFAIAFIASSCFYPSIKIREGWVLLGILYASLAKALRMSS